MPIRIGTPELIILLIIVLLLFGVGRISRVARELGQGIRELRRGLSEENEGSEKKQTEDESEAR
ncbi:MAG TPA: twin-arginine translocase TatA/TatE family subunit [Anaerolineae bacterium]|nr:twin-arginine translocase TatA/TatE family subunit [Anaerolineae bacterium]